MRSVTVFSVRLVFKRRSRGSGQNKFYLPVTLVTSVVKKCLENRSIYVPIHFLKPTGVKVSWGKRSIFRTILNRKILKVTRI